MVCRVVINYRLTHRRRAQHRTLGSRRHLPCSVQHGAHESREYVVVVSDSLLPLTVTVKVLFRNNFALGRDITNLFQSFQSSSSVLDPKANPTLFKGTLAIIIKV
jgi:hypothetical protein